MAKRERKRMTAGERIAKWYRGWCDNKPAEEGDSNLSRRIDAAIRKAAWEGFRTAYGDEWRLAAKYGPHPARRK